MQNEISTQKSLIELALPRQLFFVSLNADNALAGMVEPVLILPYLIFSGSIIEKTDLLHYSPRMKTPSKMTLRNGLTLYSSTIPSSGALLAFMIGVLDGYSDPNQKVVKNTTLPVLTFHRMVETLKYAYAYRNQMEDSDTPQMNQV